MKHFSALILCFSVLIAMSSCNRDDVRCFKTTGEASEITLRTENYFWVETYDNFDITLIPDSSNYIKISGGKNLIGWVECTVSDGILSVHDNNGSSWLRRYEPLKIEIGVAGIEKIILHESARLNCADTLHFNWFAFENHCVYCDIRLLIDCYRLEFWSHASTGDYYINGRCHTAYLYNRGTGYLHADSLIAERADMFHMSTGNSTIQVNDSLYVSKIVYGNVYLTGCPIVVASDSSYLERLFSDCP